MGADPNSSSKKCQPLFVHVRTCAWIINLADNYFTHREHEDICKTKFVATYLSICYSFYYYYYYFSINIPGWDRDEVPGCRGAEQHSLPSSHHHHQHHAHHGSSPILPSPARPPPAPTHGQRAGRGWWCGAPVGRPRLAVLPGWAGGGPGPHLSPPSPPLLRHGSVRCPLACGTTTTQGTVWGLPSSKGLYI